MINYSYRKLKIIAIITLAISSNILADITVDCSKSLFVLGSYFHGMNCVGVTSWDKNLFSTGSLNALHRGGVQILRWPGGDPGDMYKWDTKGYIPPASSFTPYDSAIGAKALFQTCTTVKNSGSGVLTDTSAAYAASWVSWAKSNKINAPLWEIGNEPEWSGQTLPDYMDVFNRQAKAMKAANPAITIMGPATTMIESYLPHFIDSCGAYADAVSIHFYIGGAVTDMLSYAQSVPQNTMKSIRAFTNKPVYITEWSCMASTSPTGTATYGLALATIDMMGAIAYSGFAGHTYFGEIHHAVDGGWGVLANGTDAPSPTYFAFPLWSVMGNMVLQVTNPYDASTVLSAWSQMKSDGSVQVLLINKTTSERTETIGLGHDLTGKSIFIYELRPTSIDLTATDVYYNNQEYPAPATQDLAQPSQETGSGMSFTYNIPAYGVTLLDFHAGLPLPTPTGIKVSHQTRPSPAVSIPEIRSVSCQGNSIVKLAISAKSVPQVKLYSGIGKLVFRGTATGNDGLYSITASGLTAGTYFVKLGSAANWQSDRIVVDR